MKRVIGGILCLLLLLTLGISLVPDGPSETETLSLYYPVRAEVLTSGGFVHTDVMVEGQAVVIRVEDNGVGIPDEDLGHVFERFYRVDKARSRAVGGTGLGLSIVRDTVLRREGTIQAAHREGGSGSVFTVRLPLAEGGAAV